MQRPTIYGEFDYSILSAFTAQLDDLERLRIAVGNRHRILITPSDKLDEDGVARGFGLPEDDPLIVAPVAAVSDGVSTIEKEITKAVERYIRHSPWGPWLRSDHAKGVGEKQLARLLGATGDPYWHAPENRPRLVSELWAYCGFHVINGESPKRRRGQQGNWSEDARKRAWLIATSCMKSGGYYRSIYDTTKAHYADAVHDRDCVRCGPSGKPAPAGSPISDGHRHGRALRAVAKEVLRDLWIEARSQHGVIDLEAVA